MALARVRDLLSSLYEKYSVDGVLTLAEMSKYNRLTAIEKRIAEIMGEVYSRGGKLVNRLTKDVYQAAFYRHEWAVAQGVGADISFGLLNPKAIEAVVGNPMAKIALEGMKDNGLRKIKREITQGLIRGDSYPKMASAIKGAFDTDARDTLRIVRTEGQRAMNQGIKEAYEEAEAQGVDIIQVWDASLDTRTRPDHAALDGVEGRKGGGYDVAWHFPSGGWSPSPGNSGIAKQDINCRCRLVGKIRGYEPKSRRIRDEGVQPYKTFADWAQEKGITRNQYGQTYSTGG